VLPRRSTRRGPDRLARVDRSGRVQNWQRMRCRESIPRLEMAAQSKRRPRASASLAKPLHVRDVFLEGFCEGVRAVAAGDEVEVFRIGRSGGGTQSVESGVGDRAGR
jgi:hypothetical protein